jgi:radical SAM enzyme (rSAM/lipoprotein system)
MPGKFSWFFHDRFRHNEARIHELRYLFWECTQRCNLNCLHCGSDCIADPEVRDMPFDDFLKAILPLKNVYDPNSIQIVITGGEPLLRADLPACGISLRKLGFRWGIVTNGWAYTPEKHAALLSAGMGSLTLSLDGFEESHNWLRSNNKSFERALQALDLIVSSPNLNYDIVTCVHSKNFNELQEFRDFLISKKVKAWRLFTIAPVGRAADNPDLQLSNQQLQELMEFIAQSRKDKQMDVKFSCESYVGRYERKVRDDYFFCRAGIHIASILIDGSVSACPNINRHFIQGNIYQDSFLDIWENRFEIMRKRSWTKTGNCLNCRDYKHCEGGAMHMWTEQKEGNLGCIHQKIQTV